VPQVRISVEAESDIDQIAVYTTVTWGWRQADKYLAKLEDCFDHLSESPVIGRPCDSIQQRLRRFEIGRHVVFDLPEADGVLIVRVLHEQKLPANYL
jgi:toxin ParE1/3/4